MRNAAFSVSLAFIFTACTMAEGPPHESDLSGSDDELVPSEESDPSGSEGGSDNSDPSDELACEAGAGFTLSMPPLPSGASGIVVAGGPGTLEVDTEALGALAFAVDIPGIELATPAIGAEVRIEICEVICSEGTQASPRIWVDEQLWLGVSACGALFSQGFDAPCDQLPASVDVSDACLVAEVDGCTTFLGHTSGALSDGTPIDIDAGESIAGSTHAFALSDDFQTVACEADDFVPVAGHMLLAATAD